MSVCARHIISESKIPVSALSTRKIPQYFLNLWMALNCIYPISMFDSLKSFSLYYYVSLPPGSFQLILLGSLEKHFSPNFRCKLYWKKNLETEREPRGDSCRGEERQGTGQALWFVEAKERKSPGSWWPENQEVHVSARVLAGRGMLRWGDGWCRCKTYMAK